MSGAIDRAARRLVRAPVLSAALLCALTFWFVSMSGTFRTPNRLTALTSFVGAVLLALTALLLARRVASAAPSDISRHLLGIVQRYAPLVVLNLIALNALAPVLGQVAALLGGVSILKTGLMIAGWLSGRVLFAIFALGLAGLLAVLAMRLVHRAARRWRPVERAVSMADRGIVLAVALYCAWAMALTFNGTFDRGTGAEHRSEILSVWGISGTPFWWADVRAWDAPGGVKRVLVFPEHDQVVPTLLAPGQRVRIRVRPGALRLAWIESMRLDFEHDLERLVAAAPSAAAPRKWLVETLLRDGRWADAARQTQAYVRHHPRDREFASRVADRLREARQAQPAAQLDHMLIAVADSGAAR